MGGVDHTRKVAQLACKIWHSCAVDFFKIESNVLELLKQADVPSGCHRPGTKVEVQWGNCSMLGTIAGVHADGRHIVRFDRGGSWGDTVRGIPLDQIREKSSCWTNH